MSGSRVNPAERQLAEQHLGDRLAALVDGELGHDSRERVLAHLATCPKCKAEADAQRRLKSVFAETAPPPPSESFLARLQGLPGGGGDEGDDPFRGERLGGTGVFGMNPEATFRYVPGPHDGPSAAMGVPPFERSRERGIGFRIHDVGRAEAERSASRGRRFAFVAAGAVSVAAIALGGVSASGPVVSGDSRGGGSGNNVIPLRPQSAGTTTSDPARRRNTGPAAPSGRRPSGVLSAPVGTAQADAPLLPGVSALSAAEERVYPLTVPMVAGAAAMSPLIRSVPGPVPTRYAPDASPAPTPGIGSRGTRLR
ncbi:anti-sigma factor family protein [Streptomyces sp. NPDC002004]